VRFAILALLAFALSYGSAHAQKDQIKRGSAPDWVIPSELMPMPADASGLVFVRRQDSLVHLDAQGQAHYLGYRIKILHANALQLGNISIAWNPAYGAPTVHMIKVHRDGAVIDMLAKAQFEILRREDQLEASRLDGTLTAVLRVADLRVGDELEVAQTTVAKDPTLGNNSAGFLFLTDTVSPGRFRLGLSWIDGQEPTIKMAPFMAAAARKSDHAVEFKFDNPPTRTPIKDTAARFQWQRTVEFSDFSDWPTLSRYFAPLYAKAANFPDTSPLKQEASRIAAAHALPLDRASAALKLVQQDVRYIYVGLDGGNLTPASAHDTWKLRYGDCKGKTALLLGLLAALGIEAEPVLANNAGTDDGLDARLPSPQMFDHVLVRARINGAAYYLDATLPPVVPPGAKPVFPYRWILPLTKQGGSLEHLQWRPSDTPEEIIMSEIDARAGFDQPARITNTSIMRGIEGLKQQVELSGLAPGALLTSLRQQLIGDTWQTIEDVQWRYDQKAQASVLKISGTGTVDWDSSKAGVKSLALPGGGFNPPSKRIRSADQNQDLPYYNKPEFACYVTTVRLPTQTQAKHWSLASEFDTQIFGRNYHRAFELREGSIRMIRGSRIEKQEIDAASAMKDNERIASFDNSMGMIYYDPSDNKIAKVRDKLVPATYDIDWAKEDVPCILKPTAN
jgi:hypothetical protein